MKIALVAVPYQMDVARWGYALGPQAFLDAGLAAQLAERGHTVGAPVWIELPHAERTRDSVTNLARLAARTAAAVRAALAEGADLALVLEGDCTHAVGAIGGLAPADPDQGAPGVAWIDAHGDLNTMATTTSGYIGGMPYAVALGWDLDDWRALAGVEPPVRAEAAALLGASDLDSAEIAALDRHPILRLDAADLMEADAGERVASGLAARAHEAARWYLHLDVDVAGPETVPGGMTPAPHWPPRARLLEIAHAAAASVPVRVIGLATYNPAGDPDGRGARFGVEMVLTMVEGIPN
jgi:arginase